jgi:hypothetical protein
VVVEQDSLASEQFSGVCGRLLLHSVRANPGWVVATAEWRHRVTAISCSVSRSARSA